MMQIYINGVEYNALANWYITEQLGNKTLSEIQVEVEDQPIPIAGDIIEMKDSGKTVFWGTCGIPLSPKYTSPYERKIYSIKCNNANAILANRIINVAYQGHTVTDIIQQLYNKYISSEGINLGEISDIPTVLEVYTAADFNLQDALNELADLVGAVWRIDNDKKFYFVAEEDFPQFPHVIDMNYILGTSLQHKTTDYKTRTVQYITGAYDTTSQQTENFTYEADQKSFTTVFPVISKPLIYVNDIQVSPDQIGVNGLDNDDNAVFYFSYNSQTISYRGSDYLTAGDIVTIAYYGAYPIRAVVQNDAKIAEIAEKTGTSGKREQVYISSGVSTMQDVLALAQSLLQQFEEATETISLWLLQSQLERLGLTPENTELLTQVTFSLPEYGVNGDFVITERTTEPLGAYGEDYKITLTMQNRDYLRSYAETISNLQRDVSALYIRQDEIVVEQQAIPETMILQEKMPTGLSWDWTPTASSAYNTIFSGFSFGQGYYPTNGNMDASHGQTIQARYPSNMDGEIFAGSRLGTDYPV